MTDGLTPLQDILGHRFANPELLARALTHASAAEPQTRRDPATYQRLEFLGDRVLGLVVADMLDAFFPHAPEGELSRRLSKLVSGETCAEVGREMDLGRFVRISPSVEKGGGRAKAGVLADACEAVLGAIYRDSGLPAARGVIERYWRTRLQSMSGPLRDAKTELQEWAHRRGFDAPSYVEVLRSGPDHAPHFEIEVTAGDLPKSRGSGQSKREAEHNAAANLLRREGVWEQT